MQKLLCVLTVCCALGCSMTKQEKQCKDWKSEGLVAGTTLSCMECIDSLGYDDPKEVRDCALGLDVSKKL